MKYEILHLKEKYPVLGEEGRDPVLAIYLPYHGMAEVKASLQKRPSILLCPGGGYARCSLREDEPIALHFLPEGYNVFILTYSTAPHRFPAQLLEVAAAMELIYEKSEEWGCDTERIAIMGFSAGGHLAAHYSTSFDCAEVRAVLPESKAVNASVLCYPVITADPAYSHKGSFKNLTGKAELTGEDIEKFSCDRQVTEHTPKAFIWHTASDATVPVMNSLLYAGALTAHQIPVELHIYPAGKHGLATADELTNLPLAPDAAHAHEWLDAAKKWMKLFL
jgi:acetyl esterase/lipase